AKPARSAWIPMALKAETPAAPGFRMSHSWRAGLLGGRLRTVDQLDVGHGRIVASAEAALEDAQVATRTARVTRAERGEQVADGFLVAQAREGEAAVGDAVDLGQRDQRLGDAAQFLGLGQGGLDQFVLE